MQDIIELAIQKGLELYKEDNKAKELRIQEERAKQQIEKEAKVTIAKHWITDNISDIIINKIRKNPNIKFIQLETVTTPKNKVLSPEILAEACKELGLKIEIENVQLKYYDEGPLEDVVHYKLLL